MEDRFKTRQVIDDDDKIITLACTGRKDKKRGELVYEGDTIVFTRPNNEQKLKGKVVYREDMLTYFVENEETEEELWTVNIFEILE